MYMCCSKLESKNIHNIVAHAYAWRCVTFWVGQLIHL